MGNNICRLILATNSSADEVARFARAIQATVIRPTSLFLRNLSGRNVRNPQLTAARDAGLQVLDIDPSIPANTLAALSQVAFGESRFVVRVADDDGQDFTLPSIDSLASLYESLDLQWALEPEDRPIPWNSEPFYICPGNPPHWSLKVPVMAALLHIAAPGQMRPCPICRTRYTSKGDRGQCPACGFVAHPFRTASEAKACASTRLDAYGWGQCPRCRKTREFSFQIEQCFNCGQILEGDAWRYKTTLVPNKVELMFLLASLTI